MSIIPHIPIHHHHGHDHHGHHHPLPTPADVEHAAEHAAGEVGGVDPANLFQYEPGVAEQHPVGTSRAIAVSDTIRMHLTHVDVASHNEVRRYDAHHYLTGPLVRETDNDGFVVFLPVQTGTIKLYLSLDPIRLANGHPIPTATIEDEVV